MGREDVGGRWRYWVVAAGLVAAACGARVEPLTIGQGPGTDLSAPGLDQGPEGPQAVPEDAATPPPGRLQGAPGGGRSPGGPRAGPLSSGPVQGAAPCKATLSSDVGVTPTSIKVGAVISITGPLPGQFNAGRDAVAAYFAMVNARGGVCGRRIEFLVADDNGDTTRNTDQTRKLLDQDKVFAFVGSFSPNDDGMAGVLCDKAVPDINFPFGERHSFCPNSFAVPGMGAWRQIGVGGAGTGYVHSTLGIKKMAIFWVREADVSKVSAWAFEAAALKADPSLTFCYEQETSVFETGFDQYAVALNNRCQPADQVAVWSTMENNNNIRLAMAMAKQGYRPKAFAVTFSSYLPSFIEAAQGTTEGAYLQVPFVPLERCPMRNDRPVPPCRHPELDRYVRALTTFVPGSDPPGSFGPSGWAQAALFVQAAGACGDNLTRACVLATLRGMGRFSANGLVSPKAPGDQRPYAAGLMMRVQGGRFTELAPPPGKTGFPEAPDLWDTSQLFDWRAFYCQNRSRFPNTQDKDSVIKC